MTDASTFGLTAPVTGPATFGLQAPTSAGKPPSESLWSKLSRYGSESVESLGEGGKELLDALIRPDAEGVKAGGELLRGVIEGSGAFVGEPLIPPEGGLVRGAPKSAGQNLMQDFEHTGVTPNVPTIGQGYAAGAAANLGKVLPFSPVTRGVSRSTTETADAVSRAAERYGTTGSPEEAGNVVRNAINRFVEDRTQAQRDYGTFFGLMQKAPPVQMTHTLATLNDIMGRFPSEPELAGLFTKSPLARLKGALTPRTETIAAKTSPVFGPNGQPIETAAARTVQRGGTLTIGELKELRTQISYMLDEHPFGPEEIPKAQLRRLYGALTQDLHAAAVQEGPRAAKALATATFNYGTRMRMRDMLRPLVAQGSPESTFRSLNKAAEGGNTGMLRTVKKAIAPSEWNEFAAAVVRRLGEPTSGTKDVLSDRSFSVGSYVTNWNKLTPAAKDELFGVDLPGTPRANLEALARVAQAQKNVGRLSNVSHSGEMVAIAGTVEEVTRALAEGRLPWAAALGLGGAYGMSRLLMSPAFTRWLYRLPAIVKATGGGPGTTTAAVTALQRALVPEPEQSPRVAPAFTLPGLAGAIAPPPPL